MLSELVFHLCQETAQMMTRQNGKHKVRSEEKLNAKGRAKSDTGVSAEKWHREGANRYCKQAKSDSGIIMTNMATSGNKGEQMID